MLEIDIQYYVITTELDSKQKEIAIGHDYEEVLEKAKEEAFIKGKLLGVRKMRKTNGFSYYDVPRLVTSTDWYRGRFED